jgi:hypothetical protein
LKKLRRNGSDFDNVRYINTVDKYIYRLRDVGVSNIIKDENDISYSNQRAKYPFDNYIFLKKKTGRVAKRHPKLAPRDLKNYEQNIINLQNQITTLKNTLEYVTKARNDLQELMDLFEAKDKTKLMLKMKDENFRHKSEAEELFSILVEEN